MCTCMCLAKFHAIWYACKLPICLKDSTVKPQRITCQSQQIVRSSTFTRSAVHVTTTDYLPTRGLQYIVRRVWVSCVVVGVTCTMPSDIPQLHLLRGQCATGTMNKFSLAPKLSILQKYLLSCICLSLLFFNYSSVGFIGSIKLYAQYTACLWCIFKRLCITKRTKGLYKFLQQQSG